MVRPPDGAGTMREDHDGHPAAQPVERLGDRPLVLGVQGGRRVGKHPAHRLLVGLGRGERKAGPDRVVEQEGILRNHARRWSGVKGVPSIGI